MFKNFIWGSLAMLFSSLVPARTVSGEGYLYLSEWLQVAQKNASSWQFLGAVIFILLTLYIQYSMSKNETMASIAYVLAVVLSLVIFLAGSHSDDFTGFFAGGAFSMAGGATVIPFLSFILNPIQVTNSIRFFIALSTFLMGIVACRLLFFA